jgi:hypothetical protein
MSPAADELRESEPRLHGSVSQQVLCRIQVEPVYLSFSELFITAEIDPSKPGW